MELLTKDFPKISENDKKAENAKLMKMLLSAISEGTKGENDKETRKQIIKNTANSLKEPLQYIRTIEESDQELFLEALNELGLKAFFMGIREVKENLEGETATTKVIRNMEELKNVANGCKQLGEELTDVGNNFQVMLEELEK